ncbi:MAG TPA: hypothetical protein EYQ54_07615, partial [Myxococcales bacterium]|nr:hypothetical protein [Myxococcales bacterium]
MEVTVDNQYDIYFGSSTIVPTYVGGDLNWPASETWSITGISSTAYLYVATASDWTSAQGFLGSFTNLTTGTVINTTTDPNLFLTFASNPWEVFPAGQYLAALNTINPSIPTGWPASTMPSQPQVETAVAYASANDLWVPVSSAPNYHNSDTPAPWNFFFVSIPGQAEWIWHDTGQGSSSPYPSPFDGYNHDEFLVFRVPGRQPVERNHHKVYQVFDIPFARRVELLDQFRNEPLDVVAGALDLFANPVDKNSEGIERPKEHQNWYRLLP